MQKAKTRIEMPNDAKKRVTDRLQSEFHDLCIQFNSNKHQELLNTILRTFESDMRDAFQAVNSSKVDDALQITKTIAEANLSNLDPCKIDYNIFKTLTENKCGSDSRGDCAIDSNSYKNLSIDFQNQAKEIFLTNFFNEISTIAKAFKDDIKSLEQKKQVEQDKLAQEKKAKDQAAIKNLSNLNNIFANRLGRGFFRIFGGGKPNLQSILTEIGLKNIQLNISIDEAKPKLIEKFKDPETAELVFSEACQNRFNQKVFDRLERIDNERFEAINQLEDLLHKNTSLNEKAEDKLKKYENAFKEIEGLRDDDLNTAKIADILKIMKTVHHEKLQDATDVKTLMLKFQENIQQMKDTMKSEQSKQKEQLGKKLAARKQMKNAAPGTNVGDIEKKDLLQLKTQLANRPQSSLKQSLNLYQQNQDDNRSSSSLSDKSNVQNLVSSRRNSAQNKRFQ